MTNVHVYTIQLYCFSITQMMILMSRTRTECPFLAVNSFSIQETDIFPKYPQLINIHEAIKKQMIYINALVRMQEQ